jgi:hypothetical protein
MLVELYIFFSVIGMIAFGISFYTKQEIFWAITLVIFGFLMATSYDIEGYVYEYNTTLGAYSPVVYHNSYPYLMGAMMIFFVLALILGMYDMFEKYGFKFFKKKET